jgi:hypothetical protein
VNLISERPTVVARKTAELTAHTSDDLMLMQRRGLLERGDVLTGEELEQGESGTYSSSYVSDSGLHNAEKKLNLFDTDPQILEEIWMRSQEIRSILKERRFAT